MRDTHGEYRCIGNHCSVCAMDEIRAFHVAREAREKRNLEALQENLEHAVTALKCAQIHVNTAGIWLELDAVQQRIREILEKEKAFVSGC